MSAELSRLVGPAAGLLLLLILLGRDCLSFAKAATGPADVTDFSCKPDGIPGGELSLPYAMNVALCSNAQLRSAAATVFARAADVGKARSEYLPSLNVTVTELREQTNYPGSHTPATTDTATTAYGALTWRLFDFGGRHADFQAARKFLEAAIATRDAVAQKILGDVVQNFFDAVTARALLRNKTEDESIARETLASAERRLGAGDGAQSDVLQATTALARTVVELNRAQSAYEKALAVLAYSVGLPSGIQYQVPEEVEGSPSVDEKSLAAWLTETRQRHPAIAAARAEVEAAEAHAASERSNGRPTVDLQANYYANGFPQEGLATTRQRSITVGLAFTIPLFDGFLRRYRVRAADATIQIKEAELLDTERMTLTEVMKAYLDAKAAVSVLRESQSLLQAAQSAEASSKRRYEAGAGDILEILNAQRALSDARQEGVRSAADWRSARLRLLATSGALSNEAMDQ